jgi:hypothetical protein
MITEAELAPLLDAVPSFESTWRRGRAEVEPDMVAHDFCWWLAAHLAARAAANDFSEFASAFSAVDRLYREGSEELATALTVGFLEDLIHIAEDRGVDLRLIAREISGSEARRYWDAAYAYTHPPSAHQ